ncbi:protein kinase domain-containing protein [Hyalangium sp.]|uniref:protein kinase domain-containing protein n=1 Tax=Hyalangium sp. TaxID=2028555 RepID=UPI002D54450A|nr:protein kinase [Hyalangium sp.]HYH97987.1 protein kinase [Hyalangium sp.]
MKQVLVALALALVHTACSAETTPLSGHQGVVDLTTWSFDLQGPVALDGEWAFDWQRLEEGSAPERAPDGYLPPLMWKGRSVGGTPLPAEGYATFRLKVLLPPKPQHLLLATSPADSAYRMIVLDGRGEPLSIFEAGTVGTTLETTRQLARPGRIPIEAANEITLVLQVSNFQIARAGPWSLPVLGDRFTLEREWKYERYMELIVGGMLIMMSLHFLTLFFLRPNERAPLWFGLFCFSLVGRIVLVGRYIEEAHPETGLGILLLRLEYSNLPGIILFFVLFLAEIFTIRPRWFVRATIVACSGFMMLAFVTPPQVFTACLNALQAFLLFGMGCLAVSLVLEVFYDKNRLALVMLGALTIFTGTVIHDVLATHQIINSSFSAHSIGGICFLFIQSSLLAAINHRMRRGLEEATAQLGAQNREMVLLNEELRAQVAIRSRSLAGTLAALLAAKPRFIEPKPGMRIGKRYELEQHLGTGGMGMVFSAKRLTDQRHVALKLISSDYASNPTALARLAREAESAAAIDHPNVVRVLDIDLDEQGTLFLAMELVDGRSLEDHRSRFGDLAWALPLLPQLLRALQAIHAGGVIHRDLKPSNILLANGVVKVVDFGIARPIRETRWGSITVEMSSESSDEVQLTRDGSILGSPFYMAPELAEGMANSSIASDLFSFGCIAYELLSARRPFDKPLVLEEPGARRSQTAPPLLTCCPGVDEQIARLIDRCLGPADTRPSTEELLAAFAKASIPPPHFPLGRLKA